MTNTKLTNILARENLSRDDLIYLLGLTDYDERQQFYTKAYAVKAKYVGRIAYYRGLIEFSITASKIVFTAVFAKIMRK